MVKNKVLNSFWKDKKVFLTGHTGFKGSWLIMWLLKKGAVVKGFSLKPKNKKDLFNLIDSELKKNFQVEFIHEIGDIRNIEKLKKSINDFKPDIVFHLAAQALVIEGFKKPVETWETNLIGTLNLLESVKKLKNKCAVVCITTDKVYKNKNWDFGYRETDELGGEDPYSASKAASEILISSWRSSYANSVDNVLSISSARAGNVIGGGDWSENRIVPDIYKALYNNQQIIIRNPSSKRPWQHVLEPLRGYLLLAEKLYQEGQEYYQGFNFGPSISNNKTVIDLTKLLLKRWGQDEESFKIKPSHNFHEAKLLHLQIDKSFQKLNWEPILDFDDTIDITSSWYENFYEGKSAFECCLNDFNSYANLESSK